MEKIEWFDGSGVRVVNSIMGTGKSQNMMRVMGENPDRKYIYISLFNKEVGDGNSGVEGRIHKELPDMNFKMPKNMGDGKVNSVKRLVSMGANIATTHALMKMFDPEVVRMIVEKNYVVVVDEAVDCISIYDDLSLGDVKTLLQSEQILVDEETFQVSWNHTKYEFDGVRYQDVMELADSGFLYLYNECALISEYPPALLRGVKDVFILSYLFEGSMFSSWLKVNKIPYSYVDNRALGLRSEEEVKEVIRQNLTLITSKELHKDNGYRDSAFSSTWFKNANSMQRAKVRKAMEAAVNTHRAKRGEIFWTTFKSRRESLEGKGYTQEVVVRTEDGSKVKLDPFLPFNIKAINQYKDFTFAMYMVNVYKHPTEIAYLKSKGVEFDQDMYACSECIQWLWRGAIRQNKPMKALIASKRMKKLVEEWLDGDLGGV
jgi:hypothetical protein